MKDQLINKDYVELGNMFDESILISKNFAPINFPGSKVNKYQFEFFKEFQKDITTILVVEDLEKDPGDNRYTFIILDSEEVLEFDTYLRAKEIVNNKQVNVFLYNIHSGIERQGHEETLANIDFVNNDEFQYKLAQVQFFNGELDYNEKYLVDWLTSTGIEFQKIIMLKSIFENIILNTKRDSQKLFEESPINRIFNTLLFGE